MACQAQVDNLSLMFEVMPHLFQPMEIVYGTYFIFLQIIPDSLLVYQLKKFNQDTYYFSSHCPRFELSICIKETS